MPVTERLQGTDSARKFTLTEDEIALSYSIYFTWGYPDYVREALAWLLKNSPRFSRISPDKELSWARLNTILGEADSPRVKMAIALSPATSAPVLNFLANSSDTILVRRVAENISTHVATLTRLIRHPSPSVRISVSEHPNLPESILLLLTQDEDADVRFALAENPGLPENILKVLCQDENPYVASRAERTLAQQAPAAQIVAANFGRGAQTRRRARNLGG